MIREEGRWQKGEEERENNVKKNMNIRHLSQFTKQTWRGYKPMNSGCKTFKTLLKFLKNTIS